MKTLKRVISGTAFLLIIGLNLAVSTPSQADNSAIDDIWVTVCSYDANGDLTGINCFNNGEKACGGCDLTAPVGEG